MKKEFNDAVVLEKIEGLKKKSAAVKPDGQAS
jgi:hypothetical protein